MALQVTNEPFQLMLSTSAKENILVNLNLYDNGSINFQLLIDIAKLWTN